MTWGSPQNAFGKDICLLQLRKKESATEDQTEKSVIYNSTFNRQCNAALVPGQNVNKLKTVHFYYHTHIIYP